MYRILAPVPTKTSARIMSVFSAYGAVGPNRIRRTTARLCDMTSPMGIKQIITDDLTGETLSDDTKATTVTLDGADYEVFLSDDSKENLIAFLNGELPLSPATRPATTRRRSSAARSGSNPAEVRAWGKSNGYKVPDRGRIPADVQAAYDAKDK